MVEFSLRVFLIGIGTRVSSFPRLRSFIEWTLFSRIIRYEFLFSDITQAEAYDILQKCVLEIQKRLIINLNIFKISVVDKNGVRRLDDISSKSLLDYAP